MVQIYCGPDVDFSTCLSKDRELPVQHTKRTKVLVDALCDGGEQVLQAFKEYLEDENIKKVWHNYSFDRHVLWNHNIDVQGF